MKIPPGWRKASLGNLTPADRKIVYGIVQAGPHMPDGIPYIRSTDVGGDLIAGDLLRTTPAIADKYNRSRVRPGDIIFSLRGNIGETSIVPLGLDGANLTQGTARISLNGEIDNHFVRYALAEYHVRKRINVTAKGSTFREITIEDLRNIEIPLAPFQEQRQISKIICCCDSAIKTNEAIIAAQVERKRGLMQQLLTGQTRFKEFKEEKWRTHRLGDLFTERVEIGRVDLALVAITGQNGVVPRDSLAKRDTSSEDKSKYLRIAPGDIGYNTMRMWQGVAGLSKIEGIVSPAYTICIPSDRIDGQFAAYLFKHAAVINLFRRYSQGLVDDTLSLKFPNFAEIHVTIPDVPEQKRIAAVLNACDSEIELLQKQLAALKEQKRGLMQKLLTGEIRVKVPNKR